MLVIKFRRGLATHWAYADTLLEAGEPGYETDTKRFKIGDGVRPWTELPYYLSQDYLASYINQVAQINPDDIEQIAEQVEDQILQSLELQDLTLLWENAKA